MVDSNSGEAKRKRDRLTEVESPEKLFFWREGVLVKALEEYSEEVPSQYGAELVSCSGAGNNWEVEIYFGDVDETYEVEFSLHHGYREKDDGEIEKHVMHTFSPPEEMPRAKMHALDYCLDEVLDSPYRGKIDPNITDHSGFQPVRNLLEE